MKSERNILIAAIVFFLGIVGMTLLTIQDGDRILTTDDRQDVVYARDSTVHENEDEGE